MYLFLIPLFLSFAFNLASAFTAAYSCHLGAWGGQLLSIVLRNVLGLPLLAVAFVLAARLPAPRLLPAYRLIGAAGWLLLLAGALLIIWALLALRWSAAAPSVGDILIRRGPYAYVRHPLYDGVFLELAGAALLWPAWPVLLSCLLTAGWVMLQVRAEEMDLRQRISAYRDYAEQVPRFIPHGYSKWKTRSQIHQ
jgi:protein-S-isoprenylcysteine O-methyltransferase Ste14